MTLSSMWMTYDGAVGMEQTPTLEDEGVALEVGPIVEFFMRLFGMLV